MIPDSQINWEHVFITVIVLIISIALHEFGHAISADRLGDPGPRRDGRVTLWPDKHFDIFGFMMIVLTSISGFGLGWGKPVMVNARWFKNPRRDMVIVAACGPLMNLLLAVVFGLMVRGMGLSGGMLVVGNSILVEFALSFVLVNLSLMFFNLIPIHPLDGGKILSGFLPADLAYQYDKFMYQWGSMILLALIFFGRSLLSSLLGPAVTATARMILGV